MCTCTQKIEKTCLVYSGRRNPKRISDLKSDSHSKSAGKIANSRRFSDFVDLLYTKYMYNVTRLCRWVSLKCRALATSPDVGGTVVAATEELRVFTVLNSCVRLSYTAKNRRSPCRRAMYPGLSSRVQYFLLSQMWSRLTIFGIHYSVHYVYGTDLLLPTPSLPCLRSVSSIPTYVCARYGAMQKLLTCDFCSYLMN